MKTIAQMYKEMCDDEAMFNEWFDGEDEIAQAHYRMVARRSFKGMGVFKSNGDVAFNDGSVAYFNGYSVYVVKK